jgi:predicted RNA-binding protein YlqC (UPF0109 family)
VSDDPNEVDEYNRADDADVEDDNDVDANGSDELAPNAVAVLEYLVQSVVDDPDAVEIEVDDDGRRPALNVTVGDGDMGRVIGKRGRVAQSIRTVTRAAAVKDELEIDIEFLD